MGKQTRVSFKLKNIISTSKPLEFLHLYLFDPSRTRTLCGTYYGFVIVDNYSRFTWTLFLADKEKTFRAFVKFAKLFQNLYNLKISTHRSDN